MNRPTRSYEIDYDYQDGEYKSIHKVCPHLVKFKIWKMQFQNLIEKSIPLT